MRKSSSGFTLIELLVIIAIIALLAVLVVVSLSARQTEARNAAAKSDVVEIGKAVEVFKGDDIASDHIISNVLGAGSDTLDGQGSGSIKDIFTGTTDASQLTYGLKLDKTPGSAYTYSYTVPTAPGPGPNRQLVGGTYLVATTLQTTSDESDHYFGLTSSGNISSSTDPVQGTITIDFNKVLGLTVTDVNRSLFCHGDTSPTNCQPAISSANMIIYQYPGSPSVNPVTVIKTINWTAGMDTVSTTMPAATYDITYTLHAFNSVHPEWGSSTQTNARKYGQVLNPGGSLSFP